jgi:hypothetical protein
MPPKKKITKRGARAATRSEGHLGATEDKVGDRTGSGAGYDLRTRGQKTPRKGGVRPS